MRYYRRQSSGIERGDILPGKILYMWTSGRNYYFRFSGKPESQAYFGASHTEDSHAVFRLHSSQIWGDGWGSGKGQKGWLSEIE
jgi:hypothetical protein